MEYKDGMISDIAHGGFHCVTSCEFYLVNKHPIDDQ